MLGEAFDGKLILVSTRVLFAAISTWATTIYFQRSKDRSEQKRLLAVLYGDVLNMRQHYGIADIELPDQISSERDRLAAS
jgi:hypothetical protein